MVKIDVCFCMCHFKWVQFFLFLFLALRLKLIHQYHVQCVVLCSAVVELGIYLYEDKECTITPCGVGLWAGLTGYCQKHVVVLVQYAGDVWK